MAEEQTIQVHVNGKYNNIFPKGYPKFNDEGLKPNNYFVFTKKFAQTKEPFQKEGQYGTYPEYNCTVIYNGQDVSFKLFNEIEGENFNGVGGEGDNVKCTLTLYKNKKGAFSPRLTFEVA